MRRLVSIVIPCYRGERFLASAIESCLAQSHANLEIIVVNDDSPDSCRSIAERYAKADDRVRVIHRSCNGGVSQAFNTGFEVARGVYFTRLAQDDLFRDDAIAMMASCLDANPSAGMVYCDMQLIDEYGNVTDQVTTAEAQGALVETNRFGMCVMWRREVWETVGGYDPAFDTADDYEWYLRATRVYEALKCRGGAPFFFRQHPSMGSVVNRRKQEFAAAVAWAKHCGDPERRRRTLARAHFDMAYHHRRNRQFILALAHAAYSICYAPASAKNYRNLAAIPIECVRARRWLHSGSEHLDVRS